MRNLNQLDMGKKVVFWSVATVGFLCMATPALAGHKVFVDKEKGGYVKIGGRIQLQYHLTDPDGGNSSDEVFFRRLRPYIEGSFNKDWKAKFQFDIGKGSGDNELSVKDAYFQYTCPKTSIKTKVGAANFPFSRELLTSSKKQQLVERTFVGDHNYGTPDRHIGIHLSGHVGENKILTWGGSLAYAGLDPDDDKLDFDNIANRGSDYNEGWMIGGRVDFHPMGQVKFSQGDFKGKTKLSMGLAVFTWSNDDDNNTRTTAGVADDASKPDVDSATGFEISGAFRGFGLSVDAQYNLFDTETIDGTVTSGIYQNGASDLTSMAIEGGFMVWPKRLELVVGYQVQDADGYADEWTRTSFGVNYFMHKHKAKVQLSYRIGENLKGAMGSDEDELFLQGQYVF